MTAAYALLALFAVGVFCGIAPLLPTVWRNFRKQGVAFCLIALGFLYSAATKPATPSITWDDYIANNGSHFTNDNTRVVFLWTKTNSMPDTTAINISAKAAGGSSWTLKATTSAGNGGYNLDIANASNYSYWVWHNWTPPTPVHTNGVWLGNIVSIPKGGTNAATMIVIDAQLYDGHRKLAPPQYPKGTDEQ